jgi:iron complex outermembrane receptor protein
VETDYTTTSLVSAETPTFVRLVPNPDFLSEELVAYEAGYRIMPTSDAYVTVSGFFNRHEDVLSTELLTPFAEAGEIPRLILPVTFGNGLTGESYGGELTADLRITPWWRLRANYSYLHIDVNRKPGSADVSQVARNEGLSPRRQAQVQSSFDLSSRWSIDWMLRSQSELRAGPVPGYTTSNVRVGWRIRPDLELAVIGRDLHADHHLEWAGSPGVEIRRSVYVQAVFER